MNTTEKLALVVIVIGLLLAGVMDGQDAQLTENAIKVAQVQP